MKLARTNSGLVSLPFLIFKRVFVENVKNKVVYKYFCKKLVDEREEKDPYLLFEWRKEKQSLDQRSHVAIFGFVLLDSAFKLAVYCMYKKHL